jgi:hypothetical protein
MCNTASLGPVKSALRVRIADVPAEETLILCYRPDWHNYCAVADEN